MTLRTLCRENVTIYCMRGVVTYRAGIPYKLHRSPLKNCRSEGWALNRGDHMTLTTDGGVRLIKRVKCADQTLTAFTVANNAKQRVV